MRALAAILAATAVAAVAARPIATLRGERNVTGLCTDVNSYAGYVDIDDDSKHYFYWGFDSQNNPADDPVCVVKCTAPVTPALGEAAVPRPASLVAPFARAALATTPLPAQCPVDDRWAWLQLRAGTVSVVALVAAVG